MIEQLGTYFRIPGISRIAAVYALLSPSRSRPRSHRPTGPRLPPPAIAEPATQWAKLSTIVDQAAQATRLVNDLQDKAQAKLDVADYALQRLMADLARVMPTMAVASTTLEPVRMTAPSRIRLAA